MKFAQTYFLLRILPIHVGILTLSGLAATGFLTSFCLILVCLWVLIFCLPFPFHPKQIKHCLGINLFWEHDSRVLKRFLFWNGILFFFLFFGLGIREAALSVSNYFEKGKKLSYKKVMCELLCSGKSVEVSTVIFCLILSILKVFTVSFYQYNHLLL